MSFKKIFIMCFILSFSIQDTRANVFYLISGVANIISGILNIAALEQRKVIDRDEDKLQDESQNFEGKNGLVKPKPTEDL